MRPPPSTEASRIIDVAAQFCSSIVGRGLYLVLQILLARQLGPLDFGLYAIGWTVVGIVGALAVVGMPQAVLRFEIGGESALFSRPMAIAAAASITATVLVVAAADTIASKVFGEPAAGPVIRAFSPTIFAAGLAGVIASALRVTGATSLSALVGSVAFALSLGLTAIAFAAWAATAVSAAAMHAAAAALTLVGAAWLLSGQPSTSGAPGLRAVWRFGVITMFIHGANTLNVLADRLVIGVIADAEAVGIYHVASQLAMVVVVLRAAVTTVFESSVPKPRPGATVPDVTREFFAAVRTLLHVSGPGLIVLGLTAAFWVRLLFGPAFAPAAAPLAVLALGHVLVTFMGPSVSALHMTGDERAVLSLTFGSLALNLAGNVALIPVLGTTGAAVASVAASFVVGFLCLVRLVRSGRLRFGTVWLRDIALGLAASLLVSAAVSHAAGPPSILSVGAMLALAYAAYGAVVLATCGVDDDALKLVKAPFGWVPRWAKWS
jgi:O-antigen/teichoic acid export membrane protein